MRKIFVLLASALFSLVAGPAIASPALYGLGDINLSAARNNSNLYTIDSSTGAATFVGSTGFNLRGLTIDPLSGRAFASAAQSSGSGGLYEINLSTGAASLVGGTQNYSEMVFDGSGNLFGYGDRRETGAYNFYSIDVSTGVGTLLNDFAISTGAHALFGIAYSSSEDETYLFQSGWGSGDGLWTVDLTDGTVTAVVLGANQPYRPELAADSSGNLFSTDRDFGTNGTNFYSVDKTTGNTTLIGSNGAGINSLAFASSVTVPEPGAIMVLALGVAGIAYSRRKRMT